LRLGKLLELAFSHLRFSLLGSFDEDQLDGVGAAGTLGSLHLVLEFDNHLCIEGREEQVEFREAGLDGSGSGGGTGDREVVVRGDEGGDGLLSLLESLLGRLLCLLRGFTVGLRLETGINID
jgi:hypothetical protein